jgi:hypothetical protein
VRWDKGSGKNMRRGVPFVSTGFAGLGLDESDVEVCLEIGALLWLTTDVAMGRVAAFIPSREFLPIKGALVDELERVGLGLVSAGCVGGDCLFGLAAVLKAAYPPEV